MSNRSSVQPAGGGLLWRTSERAISSAIDLDALANRHRIEINAGGDWSDGAYRSAKVSTSLTDWFLGRRGSVQADASSTHLPGRVATGGGLDRWMFDGYLEKMGSWRKNWKRRWFVLTPNSLAYYKHHAANAGGGGGGSSGGGEAQQKKNAEKDAAVDPYFAQALAAQRNRSSKPGAVVGSGGCANAPDSGTSGGGGKEPKLLGEVFLVARGADGHITVSMVWDYSAALEDGHTDASQSLLAKYAPPSGASSPPASSSIAPPLSASSFSSSGSFPSTHGRVNNNRRFNEDDETDASAKSSAGFLDKVFEVDRHAPSPAAAATRSGTAESEMKKERVDFSTFPPPLVSEASGGGGGGDGGAGSKRGLRVGKKPAVPYVVWIGKKGQQQQQQQQQQQRGGQQQERGGGGDGGGGGATAELARCVGIRCAATQQDLFFRAQSPKEAREWARRISRQSQRALRHEVASSGAVDHLAALHTNDELRALTPHTATITTTGSGGGGGGGFPHQELNLLAASAGSAGQHEEEEDRRKTKDKEKKTSPPALPQVHYLFSDPPPQGESSPQRGAGEETGTPPLKGKEDNGGNEKSHDDNDDDDSEGGEDEDGLAGRTAGLGLSVRFPLGSVCPPDEKVFVAVFAGRLPHAWPTPAAGVAAAKAAAAAADEAAVVAEEEGRRKRRMTDVEAAAVREFVFGGGASSSSNSNADAVAALQSASVTATTTTTTTSRGLSLEEWSRAELSQVTALLHTPALELVATSDSLSSKEFGAFELSPAELDQAADDAASVAASSLSSSASSSSSTPPSTSKEAEEDGKVGSNRPPNRQANNNHSKSNSSTVKHSVGVVLRQFAVVVDAQKTVLSQHQHLAFVLYRRCGKGEELESHEVVGFTCCEVKSLRAFTERAVAEAERREQQQQLLRAQKQKKAGENDKQGEKEEEVGHSCGDSGGRDGGVKSEKEGQGGRRVRVDHRRREVDSQKQQQQQQQPPTSYAVTTLPLNLFNAQHLAEGRDDERSFVDLGIANGVGGHVARGGGGDRSASQKASPAVSSSSSSASKHTTSNPPPFSSSFPSSSSSSSPLSQQFSSSSSSGRLALSVVLSTREEAQRRRRLRRCNGFGLDPYSCNAFRFVALNGSKVSVHSECHLSPFAAAVPLAVVSLLCSERFAPLAADKSRLEHSVRALDRAIKRRQHRLQSLLPSSVATTTAHALEGWGVGTHGGIVSSHGIDSSFHGSGVGGSGGNGGNGGSGGAHDAGSSSSSSSSSTSSNGVSGSSGSHHLTQAQRLAKVSSLERTLHMLREQRQRCSLDSECLDELVVMQGAYLKCKELYGQMLRLGGGVVGGKLSSKHRNTVLLGAPGGELRHEEVADMLQPISPCLGGRRERFLLKRSACKTNSALRFVPTNLNVQVMHAMEKQQKQQQGETSSSSTSSSPVGDLSPRSPASPLSPQSPPLPYFAPARRKEVRGGGVGGSGGCGGSGISGGSVEMGEEGDSPTASGGFGFGLRQGGVGGADGRGGGLSDTTRQPSTFVTVTMGCPSTHAMGFKAGGLRRLLTMRAAGRTSSRLQQCRKLSDWSAAGLRLELLAKEQGQARADKKSKKEQALALEKSIAFDLLAQKRAAEQEQAAESSHKREGGAATMPPPPPPPLACRLSVDNPSRWSHGGGGSAPSSAVNSVNEDDGDADLRFLGLFAPSITPGGSSSSISSSSAGDLLGSVLLTQLISDHASGSEAVVSSGGASSKEANEEPSQFVSRADSAPMLSSPPPPRPPRAPARAVDPSLTAPLPEGNTVNSITGAVGEQVTFVGSSSHSIRRSNSYTDRSTTACPSGGGGGGSGGDSHNTQDGDGFSPSGFELSGSKGRRRFLLPRTTSERPNRRQTTAGVPRSTTAFSQQQQQQQQLPSIGERSSAFNDALVALQRLDAATTQILSAAVAQCFALLAAAASGSAPHRHILPRVLQCGFLVSLQSLVSTRGDELGMLEDMVVASEWLSTVTLRLVAQRKESKSAKNDTNDTNEDNDDDGSERNLAEETAKKASGAATHPESPVASTAGTASSPPQATAAPSEMSHETTGTTRGAAAAESHRTEARGASTAAAAGEEEEEDEGEEDVEEAEEEETPLKQPSSPSSSSSTPLPPPSSVSFPGVWARRSPSNGGIVLDVAVDPSVAAVVREASHFVLSSVRKAAVSSAGIDGGVRSATVDPRGRGGTAPTVSDKGGGAEASPPAKAPVGGGTSADWELLASLPLVGVVFQQGINEQQAVCNALGALSAQHLQAQVNLESLERLGEYFERYRRVAEVQAVGQGVKWQAELARECESWEEALANVQRTASGPTNKTNVHLILHASDLCRQLSGVHAICCKSGKDRTGMGVTLEEARLLCDHLRVVEGRRCCKLMRRFGVRRDNVEANTGQRKYAFNDVQRLFLPKCFQPPQGSYSGGVLA